MSKGVIKWFDSKKRYGFITQDGGGPDVFVHQEALKDRDIPREGDRVDFQVKQTPKGIQAIDVRVL